MGIKTNLELMYELDKYPENARINVTYSDNVEEGTVEVGYDDESNTIQIVGSSDDV
ncbi:hypothetical protein [Hydrotalea sp. AMD]|uniref:hypothetical protein n=1 Tax=Hydrotalea sp. AMD TaxID=2501297 RepID=UPI00257A4406|nr:hypothetical protein [Hydrotalea sp. AMD]